MAQAKSQTLSAAMQLWHSAIPINEARLKFADAGQGERLRELLEVGFMSELGRITESGTKKNVELLEVMQKITDAMNAANDERFPLEKRINQNFFDLVEQGDVRCFAFDFPRKASSEPIEINVQEWTVYPNWKKGEFKANGLHLIEIRAIRQKDSAKLISPPEPVAAGRPTIRDHVKAAFDALEKSGGIIPTNSAKYHYPMIRQWIDENSSDTGVVASKLSDEGIRAHFSPLFKELKENRKQ